MRDVLILHGWGSSSEKWNQVKKILENQEYRVFVPDLPGFGENPPPPKDWFLDDYVEWVKEFCERNGLSQFFLLGHSFGGAIAVKFALRFPEKIDKLFLLDAACFRRKAVRKKILYVFANFFKKFSFLPYYNFFRKGFYKLIIGRSDYPYTEGVMKDIYLKIIQEDLSEIMLGVQVPTIIIWGEKDRVTPVKEAYLINEKIKKSKLEIIPSVGHSPHKEIPEKLAQIILRFLRP